MQTKNRIGVLKHAHNIVMTAIYSVQKYFINVHVDETIIYQSKCGYLVHMFMKQIVFYHMIKQQEHGSAITYGNKLTSSTK